MKRLQKPMIITFLGPVGVGKSTQMRLLRAHLNLKGMRVTDTFLKSTHGFSHLLRRALVLLGAFETVRFSEGSIRTYPRKEIMQRLFLLWRLLDSLSITLKFFFTVYLPYRLGFNVLVEEGLIMTVYTYVVSFPYFFHVKARPLRLPLYLLAWVERQKHVNVILDANDEELALRREKRSFRREELSDYVTMQKKWANNLDLHDTILIDTTDEPLLDVSRGIASSVDRLMKML